jgi:hypothetical protein
MSILKQLKMLFSATNLGENKIYSTCVLIFKGIIVYDNYSNDDKGSYAFLMEGSEIFFDS